jgi:hypothetical protein
MPRRELLTEPHGFVIGRKRRGNFTLTSVRRDNALSGCSIWILVMFLMSYTPLAFPEANHAPNEQEIIDVSVARREATNRREMTAAAAYIAKDCLFSTEYGAVISKDEYIEHRRKMPAAYDQTTNPRQYVVHV